LGPAIFARHFAHTLELHVGNHGPVAREVNGNRVGRHLTRAQRETKRGLKIGLKGIQPMHRKETDGGPKIRLGGIQPMCGEETEGD